MPRDTHARLGQKVDWSPENIETLRAGVAAGDSFGIIAKRIPNCGRGAAIGKANRLGIPRPTLAAAPARLPRTPSSGRRLSAPPVARAQYQNAGLSFKTRTFVVVDGNAPNRPPRAVMPETAFAPLEGSTPRPWTERLSGMCCWPVGGEGGETLSCCEPVFGRGWCRDHFRRGVVAAPVKARVDERVGKDVARAVA